MIYSSYSNQQNANNKKGKVLEIKVIQFLIVYNLNLIPFKIGKNWKENSLKSGVLVHWLDTDNENVYRHGFNGQVNLKYFFQLII